MKIKRLEIENYRNFTKKQNLIFGDLTTIIGKNNEGKSNAINALRLFMMGFGEMSGKMFGGLQINDYNLVHFKPDRDIPKNSQTNNHLNPKISVEFELNKTELKDLSNILNSQITENLLNISLYISGESSYTIHTNSETINNALMMNMGNKYIVKPMVQKQFANFVISNINLVYIPSVRTESNTLVVMNEIVSDKLKTLEHDKEYKRALGIINTRTQNLLTELSNITANELKLFAPYVKNIDIRINQDKKVTNNVIEMDIDDGSKTELQNKGDGIKSLVFFALINSKIRNETSNVIAVEEPEAHLHSDAIYQVASTIKQIAKEKQVILTTHNPIFINRIDLSSNFIIDKNSIRPAKNLKEIRELLGIRVSENLSSAEVVIIVEGETDIKILEFILSQRSAKIKQAIENGVIIFSSMRGVGNLSYKCALYKDMACHCVCFIDNDACARDAMEKTIKEGLASYGEIFFATSIGKKESEIEDLINLDIYKQAIFDTYGIELRQRDFSVKAKWSNNIKNIFIKNGKLWGENLENQVKVLIANSVVNTMLTDIINTRDIDLIETFKKYVENLIVTK